MVKRLRDLLQPEQAPAEELTLPDPARTLWIEIHGAVQKALERSGPWRLGGGTLLAARWKHRSSVDIDLTIEPRGRNPQRIDHLIQEGHPFREEIRRLGGKEATTESRHHIRIEFPESGLDISVLGTVPEMGERDALVNGIRARVLTTTQVLGGKLSRPEQLLHRDAYDLRHAGKVDRQSLAEAMNGIERRDAENIISTWNGLSGRWCAMAHDALKDVVPKHSYDAATLPAETAEALRDALYERVLIRTHGREGRFEAETAGGTTIEVAFTRRTLEKTFSEHGITDYLRAQTMGDDPDEILKRVKRTCSWGTRPETPWKRTHRTRSLEEPRAATREAGKGGGPLRPAITMGPAIKRTPGRKLNGPSGR